MRRRPHRASSGDVNASRPLIFQHNPAPISPPSSTAPTMPPSRPRIHRKALRRGGVGAGREGVTRNFMHRACGKWSPSGDTGETAGCRTDPVVLRPERRAGRACATHKGIGIGGCVGIVRRDGEGREVETPSTERQGVRSGCQTALAIPETGEGHRHVDPCRETGVAGKNRRTGRRKVSPKSFSVEAASGAPSDRFLKPRAKTPRGARPVPFSRRRDFVSATVRRYAPAVRRAFRFPAPHSRAVPRGWWPWHR